MKKILILSIALLIIPNFILAGTQKATVFSPDTGDRKQVNVGDVNAFDGGYLLETSYGYKALESKDLGFSVASGYRTTLSRSLTSSGATINVSKMTTPDDVTLTMGVLGTKVFLTIEPGSSREEIVMCTGISSLTWTTCTRGLAFYGTSTSAVTANQKAHNSGAIITMANVHYVYDELADKDSAETVGGDKTYTGDTHFYKLPTATSTTGTDDTNLITLGQANALVNQGAATSSETSSGISEQATKAETAAGTAFDANNPHFISSEIATTTGGQATTSVPVTGTDGKLDQGFLDLTEDFTFSGDNTIGGTLGVTGTTTFSNNVIGSGFGGNGSDGALSVTSGTTTIAMGSANTVVKNYTSINIATGTELTFSGKGTAGTILILKSQGDCTIAGQVDLVGMGANAGAEPWEIFDTGAHLGVAGEVGQGGGTDADNAGGGGAIYTSLYMYTTVDADRLYRKNIIMSVGAGGGAGGVSSDGGGTPGASGAGGAGGGSLIIECGGILNFVTGSEILIDGASGSDGGAGVGAAGGGGGGGGGASGMALILYNYLNTDSGVIQARGGAGGDSGAGGANVGNDTGGQGGGGGGCYTEAGKTGGFGDGTAAGNAGTATTNCAGASGAGGGADASSAGASGGAQGNTDTNMYLVAQNIYF